jgi:hypothetical protein
MIVAHVHLIIMIIVNVIATIHTSPKVIIAALVISIFPMITAPIIVSQTRKNTTPDQSVPAVVYRKQSELIGAIIMENELHYKSELMKIKYFSILKIRRRFEYGTHMYSNFSKW